MNTDPITSNDVLAALTRHIGKAKGVTVGNLVYEVTGQAPCASTERDVRRIITELRLAGHHICAHPGTGYFIAANDDELNETCKFLVNRCMTGLKQVSRMKKVSMPDLHGQLNLPT